MPKIVVVDNAAFMRMRASKLLTQNGYQVVEAENDLDPAATYQIVRDQYSTDAKLAARAALHARFSTAKVTWFDWVFDRILLADATPLPGDLEHTGASAPAPATSGQCRILEVGAGAGWLWRANAARIPTTWQITLTDLSAGMIESARTTLAAAGVAARFEVADAQELAFPDATFDAVVANHMLYHVPDRRKALAEIRRVLKPGGRLLAATNGSEHMHEIDAIMPSNRIKLVLGFRLENGAKLLSPFFQDVTREDFPDSIEATDADAVVDYALSMMRLNDVALDAVAIRANVQATIDRNGSFHVTKQVGLFTALR